MGITSCRVESTIDGIGERVGDAALEEIVMALKTRQDFYGLTTDIKTERPCPMSRMVSTVSSLKVQRNMTIVGQNAFAHEPGIHQDGMLKERSTHEVMRPDEIGVPNTELMIGRHTARHAMRDRCEHDRDRRRLDPPPRRGPDPGRRDRRRPGRRDLQGVKHVAGIAAVLREFAVRDFATDEDTQHEVSLKLGAERDDRTLRDRAASTEIIEAPAEAYINVVNAILTNRDQPAR